MVVVIIDNCYTKLTCTHISTRLGSIVVIDTVSPFTNPEQQLTNDLLASRIRPLATSPHGVNPLAFSHVSFRAVERSDLKSATNSIALVPKICVAQSRVNTLLHSMERYL
jgi:hypothetical protein